MSSPNYNNPIIQLSNYLSGIGKTVLGQGDRFNFSRNWQLPNQRTILVDVSFNELFQVALNVPHLNVVISRGAEMFSNMEIKHVDKNGEEIENSDIIKLLNAPNPMQSLQSWLYDFYVNNAIYSSTFMYKNKGVSFAKLPSVLWWLPSGWMKINATGKMFDQTSIDGIIESYDMLYSNKSYKPSEILHMIDGFSQNKLAVGSKIEALQLPLSNIMAALKSNNIILTERGLIGFISGDEKSTSGMGVEMTPEERTKFERQYQSDRSLDNSQSHVMITGATMKWVPMTFDVKQLMLYEGLEDSFGLICGEYGIDRDIFPSTKGATNENKEMGLKTTIQNTMQPLGTKLLNNLAKDFDLPNRGGEKLIGSWSSMPVMQEDALAQEQAFSQKVNGLSVLKKDGIISPKQYAERAEVDFDGTGITEGTTPPEDKTIIQ